MEKASRAGRAEAMARAMAQQQAAEVRPATPEHLRMPGAGYRLTPVLGDDAAPPAYESGQTEEPEDDADGDDDEDAAATEETRLVDTN